LEFVFLDRRYEPTFDVDHAAMCFVLIAHNTIVGQTSENGLHIVCVTRVDISFNYRAKNDGYGSKKDSAISAAAQILARMRALSIFLGLILSSLGAQAADTIAAREAKIDNVQLHYLTAGHGPAVILFHGYTQTSRMWRPIIPLLAGRFTVIAPDLPGIGDSSIPADNEIGMITAAKQIHELVRSLKIAIFVHPRG
jgi:alpha/beta hydrolase family protein